MNWIGLFITLLQIATVLVSVLLVFVVLLQRPKNEGLGAAFGGDTASNLFGAQTTNVLANVTRWLGGIFLLLCFLIAILGTHNSEQKAAVDEWKKKAAEDRAARALEAKTLEEANKAKQDAENKAAAPAGTPAVPAATPVPGDKKPELEKSAATSAPAPATPAIPASPEAKPEATKPPATDSKPAEAPKPAEPAKPADAPATPAPAEAPKQGAPAPAEAPKPAAPEPAKPAEEAKPAPSEAPKPAEPAKPAEGTPAPQ